MFLRALLPGKPSVCEVGLGGSVRGIAKTITARIFRGFSRGLALGARAGYSLLGELRANPKLKGTLELIRGLDLRR